MQEPVLTLFITTPQSWAERHAIKRRRIPRSPKRHVVKIPRRHSHPKMQDLQKALVETRSPVKKSPTNGLQLDPFQTFPIPTTPCVSSMAQYCESTDSSLIPRDRQLKSHSPPSLGRSARSRLRSRGPPQSVLEPSMAVCVTIRYLL